jgi:TolB-like protein/Flp pilus assembly protein TadD/class 3 adenylate cyclase
MPVERKPDLHLEIAHVLFLDVVGFSKLLINDQTEILQQLNRIVRETPHFREAEAAGKLIRLATGDGMALVFSNSAEAPVECALEITKALKSYPQIQLRMGVHSGPINAVSDVNDRSNVTGAGINIAQRVMDCGDAGHILLSRHVAEDLEQYRQWQPCLHDLGECEVKHGVRVHVVNFYTEDFGNPAVPERFGGKKNSHTRSAVIGAPKRSLQIGFAVAGFALVVFVALLMRSLRWSLPAKPQVASSTSDKSVAVLPFENLSDDKGNAYFVDGIQDEILTRLAKVADLKVTSRTSTQQFKSKPGNLPEIAKQLGVAHILEGSAQRLSDQVRVNVQLINAATDAHLWAETYDRKLTDVFTVETEIATKIADTLQAKLSDPEHQAIAARPTENMEAHELYLKGRYFGGRRTADDLERAIDYYNQALAKDPNYAVAYAGIANSYMLLQQYSNLTVAEAFPKAHAAASKALAIDNNLGEAHAALAFAMVSADFNFKEAKREFERAIQLNPNSAEAHYFFGISVLLPLGQFDQAIAEIKHAIALDPFSVIMNANLGLAHIMARRYPEAIVQLRKTVELDPSNRQGHSRLGYALWLNGDVPGAIGEYEKQRELGRKVGREYYAIVYLAHLYGVSGKREKALELFDEAKQLEQRAGVVWAYGYALIQIGLGDKEQAIDWLERSYEAKEAGGVEYIRVDPQLDPLRGDPRFEKLADQVVPPAATR